MFVNFPSEILFRYFSLLVFPPVKGVILAKVSILIILRVKPESCGITGNMEKLCVLENGFVAFLSDLQDKVLLVDFNGAETYPPSRGSEDLFVVLFEDGKYRFLVKVGFCEILKCLLDFQMNGEGTFFIEELLLGQKNVS